MAVQQSKVSKSKVRTRHASNRYEGIQASVCSACGAPCMPHHVCKKCGQYRGRQILTIKSDAEA